MTPSLWSVCGRNKRTMIGSIRSLHGLGWNGIAQRALLGSLNASVSPVMAVHERQNHRQRQQEQHHPLQQRRTMAAYRSRKGGFRPKRLPDKNYRPLQIPKKRIRVAAPGNPQTLVELNPQTGAITDLEGAFGSLGAEVVEAIRNERDRKRQHYKLGGNLQRDEAEESLRLLDYYIADEGSLEDRVFERRALSIDYPTQSGREKFVKDMEDFVKNQTLADMDLDPESIYKQHPIVDYRSEEFGDDPEAAATMDQAEDDPEVMFDPNQLAFGEWSEFLITVDRNVKLWRGGRLESYRALVVGGNLNGCGGFGVGKATDALEAVAQASKKTKRNIFFIDRYQGDGITCDLAGKHNNCKVVLRATDNGLRGNELIREILKRIGITNVAAKAYGKRNLYNVVYATFKALLTHESIEDISLKRGKRLMSLDKAKRLQI